MFVSYFFFQAEDGIRDLTVTGVQTCALPIWMRAWRIQGAREYRRKSPSRGFCASQKLPNMDSLLERIRKVRRRQSGRRSRDRKSTRLNSSHSQISYAVFCLKKKKTGRFATSQ